jgi:hypothetical protein
MHESWSQDRACEKEKKLFVGKDEEDWDVGSRDLEEDA